MNHPMSAGVLVCVKRVPDATSEVVLTEDGQSVDGRFAGFTTSPHEECAVELAVQAAAATGGEATVLTLGDADAIEQLRAALAVGCTAATHVVADAQQFGPADVAREIAAVVRDHEAAGRPHDLVLLGNDAADTGDFQVGIRLAHELGRPVVTGVSKVSRLRGRGPTRRDGERGRSRRLRDLPRAAARRRDGARGRRRAALPDGPRPDEGQEGARSRSASRRPRRPAQARVRWSLPPAAPSDVQVLGTGPEAAPAVVDLLEQAGSAGQMILVLVEKTLDGAAVEVSLETLTFARSLSEAGGGVPVDAVRRGRRLRPTCRPSSRRTACARSTA